MLTAQRDVDHGAAAFSRDGRARMALMSWLAQPLLAPFFTRSARLLDRRSRNGRILTPRPALHGRRLTPDNSPLPRRFRPVKRLSSARRRWS